MPSLKKNIIYRNMYQVLITLIPLITAPYLSRVLGAENIGVYSYTFSIVSYFVLFAMLGIRVYGSRAIAIVRDNKEKLNKTFSDLFFLQLGISVFVLIVYTLFLLFFAGEYRIFFAIQIFTLFSALLDIHWFFSGVEQIKIILARSCMIRLVYVACLFIFVKNEGDLWIYVLLSSLSAFLNNSILWFFLRKYISLIKPAWRGIKSHIKPLLILFIPVIAVSIYGTMDKIILGSMSGEVQLAHYANAEKIYNVVIGFIVAFSSVMIPRMSNLATKGSQSQKKRLTIISMKYLIFFSIGLTFGLSAIANDFAPLFFGRAFVDSGVLIIGLSIMIPFVTFQNVISSHHILPNSNDKAFTVAIVAGASVSISANMILIPKFQAMGAVVARILAEVTVCIIITMLSRKSLPIFTYIKNSMFFLFTGIAMFFTVRFIGGFMRQGILSILVQSSVGAAFYLGASVAYLYITKDELFLNALKWVIRAIKKESGKV